MLLPLASSDIQPIEEGKGGLDADGVWTESVGPELHANWWSHWSRDMIAILTTDLNGFWSNPQTQQDWWKRAESGSARIFIDYTYHPSDADVEELESLGSKSRFVPNILILFQQLPCLKLYFLKMELGLFPSSNDRGSRSGRTTHE